MAQDDLLWMKDFLQDDLYLLEADKNLPFTAAATTIPEAVEKTVEPTFNCLGKANSGFLILVSYPNEEHIDAAHLQSLHSILGRKNLGPNEVTILNLAKQTNKAQDAIINYFKPQRLLIMGADALPDGLIAPQLNSVIDGNPKTLYVLSFTEMDSNDKKRLFWDEMKNF